MPTPTLTAAERASLKAQAHSLSPVVMIGDAGLTPNVVTEIERALSAHALIKIRVLGDDRAERLTLLESICVSTGAAPVQQIGKLLIVYRAKADDASAKQAPRKAAPPSRKGTKPDDAPRRNPVSGRIMTTRTSAKKAAKGPLAKPPRTERVRKSGQKSTKKAFQTR